MKLVKSVLFAFLILSLIPVYLLYLLFALFFLLLPFINPPIQPSDTRTSIAGIEMLEVLIKKPITFLSNIHKEFFM